MTRSFLDKLFLNVIDLQKHNTIVLDQALSPYNPEKYLKYFNSVKVIVIDRDPRDIFNELSQFSSYPTSPVKNFITYFKSQRDAVKRFPESKFILDIKFENLINNYETELERIYNFFGVKSNIHKKKKQFFDPAQSAKNVGIWKRMEDNEDIKLIEKELKEYLYQT